MASRPEHARVGDLDGLIRGHGATTPGVTLDERIELRGSFVVDEIRMWRSEQTHNRDGTIDIILRLDEGTIRALDPFAGPKPQAEGNTSELTFRDSYMNKATHRLAECVEIECDIEDELGITLIGHPPGDEYIQIQFSIMKGNRVSCNPLVRTLNHFCEKLYDRGVKPDIDESF